MSTITIKNKPLPSSKKKLQTRSNAPTTPRKNRNVAYFISVKNVYARKGPYVVRLHKDGYFRRHAHLPTQICSPLGPQRITNPDKNEIRRGLFLKPLVA